MLGILRCSRYSFGPNRLHYCGPDANAQLQSHIDNEIVDPGLEHILREFKTLYPYLQHIARANRIIDPFDSRVVEAYWLGNELLDAVGKRQMHQFLIDDLQIKKKMGDREFQWLEEKIGEGALPHHSFHVMNIWRRTGHKDVPQTLESMDECRVSSGVITSVSGPAITVMSEPLVYVGGRLELGEAVSKTITRELEAEYDIEQLKPGQIVSIHWSVPCEVITEVQAQTLKKFTLKNVAFANKTI